MSKRISLQSLSARNAVLWCVILFALSQLSACDTSEGDIVIWMKEQRANTPTSVKPIPEPKPFVAQAFTGASYPDPFSNQKLLQVLRSETATTSATQGLIAPELQRRKQVLEDFPLDSMTMVGFLRKNGKLVALVRTNNKLYEISQGEYMGQNYGRVVQISENGIKLREIVQDGQGEWIERPASLDLQESTK